MEDRAETEKKIEQILPAAIFISGCDLIPKVILYFNGKMASSVES